MKSTPLNDTHFCHGLIGVFKAAFIIRAVKSHGYRLDLRICPLLVSNTNIEGIIYGLARIEIVQIFIV